MIEIQNFILFSYNITTALSPLKKNQVLRDLQSIS